MNRVLVVGSGGSGKTMLAARLGEILDLPVIHLDAHFWQPGWVASTPAQWAEKVGALCSMTQWVMDGNYSGTLAQRLAVCDAIVFLDIPRRVCLYRVLKRVLRYHGENRPGMPEGCKERFDLAFLAWIWAYPKRSRARVLSLISEAPPHVDVFHVRTRDEVRQLLVRLEAGAGTHPRGIGQDPPYHES